MIKFWNQLKLKLTGYNSAVNKLLAINITVFLCYVFINVIGFFFKLESSQALNFLKLPSYLSQIFIQPWSIITFSFLHLEPLHLIMNMLLLYFIGHLFQDFLGSRRLYEVYFGAAISSAILLLLCFKIFPVFHNSDMIYVYGASASTIAILVSCATLLPNYALYMFGIWPVKLKWLALFMVAITFMSIQGKYSGTYIVHLGGAIFGFCYIKFLKNHQIKFHHRIFARIMAYFKTPKPDERAFKKPKISINTYHGKQGDYRPNQIQIDAILDKISKSGYDSLSKEEKELLYRASEQD